MKEALSSSHKTPFLKIFFCAITHKETKAYGRMEAQAADSQTLTLVLRQK
jgi:hypothetical protein